MAYIRTAIDAIVRELIKEKIYSSFIQSNPLLYLLAGPDIDNKGKLGQPSTPTVFGGSGLSMAQKMTRVGSKEHHFRYQTVEPSETAAVSYRGATPQSSLWAEDAFGTAVTRWTHHETPIKISKHALMMAKGGLEIGSVVEDASGPVINSHLDALQNSFWNGTQTATQQAVNMWTDYLGVVHTINQNNVYARIDRAVETEMNSLIIAGGGNNPTLSLIRQVNVGNNIAARSPNGMGIDLVVTTPNIWMILAEEAEGRWQITVDGIQNHAFAGFKRPMIRYDHTWIVPDEDCPPGCMFMFHTPSWMYEINPEGNFNLSPWIDKDETEEAGGYYIWAKFKTIGRLTCREPWLQARVCGLTEETSESLSSSSSSSYTSSQSSASSLSTTSASSQSTSSQSDVTSD